MVVKSIDIKSKHVTLTFEDDSTLEIHLEAYIKSTLKEGASLTPSKRKALVHQSAYYDALEHAYKALTHKPYTVKAMKETLLKRFSLTVVEDTLKTLETTRYLDDQALIKSRLDDALSFSLKGPNALKEQWLRFGFTKRHIEDTLSHVDEEVWLKRCESLLEVTLKAMPISPLVMQKQKLYHTAMRQGYTREMIESAMRRVTLEETDETALLKADIARLKGRYDVRVPKEKNAFIQALLRRGYRYETIKEILG